MTVPSSSVLAFTTLLRVRRSHWSFRGCRVHSELKPELILRPASLLALLTRTFTFELALAGSPRASVEYDYVGKQSIPTTGLSPASPTALWAAEQEITPTTVLLKSVEAGHVATSVALAATHWRGTIVPRTHRRNALAHVVSSRFRLQQRIAGSPRSRSTAEPRSWCSHGRFRHPDKAALSVSFRQISRFRELRAHRRSPVGSERIA